MPPNDAGAPAPRSTPSALAALRFPVFRGVWSASTISNIGGLIQSVGASWMMLSITHSAAMVALVQASSSLPIVLLALIAGAVADNADRRKVMLGTQFFMLIVSIALAAFAWAGWITPWLLLTFTFLIGCGGAFNAPAWHASVGEMVPRHELPGAVALNSMGFNIARSLGPAVGGAIVATAGAAAAFVVNAATYLPLIGVLVRWKPAPGTQLLPRETLGIAVATGIRYVAMSPAIRIVLLRALVFGVGASSVLALMPLMAKVLLNGGALTYGFLLGSFGVGAVGGALASARLRDSLSAESIVRLGSLAFALAAACAALSTYMFATMFVLLLAGAGWLLSLSTFNISVQLSTPRWVVARALSIYQMTAFAGIAGGSWLWGVVAESASVTISLLIAAAVLLTCAAMGRWFELGHYEQLDLDPLRQWKEPTTVVPVESRTGPVVITIEYVIRPEHQLEFLAAMAERRRIRRRDGARNWRLLRDLADPELWIERYETPTWLDYVRINNRLTRSDAVIPERLRALHKGPEGPRVRRMIERPTVSLPASQPPEQHELAESLGHPTQAP